MDFNYFCKLARLLLSILMPNLVSPRDISGGLNDIECFTSHPAGNMVDDLPPASSSDLDVGFGFKFGLFSKVLNLFWPWPIPRDPAS